VAFSGEVSDKESGPEPFTETGQSMNPGLKGRSIRDAFDTEEYHVLLVANKFQTGFDQPLLCGMYVDKKLAGIQAVQTLSRLNRAYPGKDTTYVLDFANSADQVLEAFQMYYETATLADTSDPNNVLNLRTKLDALGYYDDHEVDRVVAAVLKPGARQSELVKAIEPVFDRLMRQYKEAQEAFKAATASKNEDATQRARERMEALQLFKRDMGSYLRLYTFMSQIFDYGDPAMEKRAIFYRQLIPLLDFGRESDEIDPSKLVLTHHNLRNRGRHGMSLGGDDRPELQPISETGSGQVQEKEKALLREILEKVNGLFEGDLTDQDKLVYVNDVIRGKLLESKTLQKQALNNKKEQFSASPDLYPELRNAGMTTYDAHTSMSGQLLGSEEVQRQVIEFLLGPGGLYEALRERAG